MRVFVEPSGRRITPFGDPPGESLILNRRLADLRAEWLREAGFETVERPGPQTLVIPDTLFTTGPTLRRFVDAAAGRNAVLVLADSLFARRTTPVQPHVTRTEGGFRFEKIRFVGDDDAPPREAVIDPDERLESIEIPVRFVEEEEPAISLVRYPVLTIHHWIHILWANQTAALTRYRTMSRGRMFRTGLIAALRALSLNRWKVMGRCNRIGRGCNIHPTAVVEISDLGEGVNVGPFARVFASTVGDGAMIGAAAQVEASVVGERSFVAQQSCLRGSVTYPESAACFQMMQLSILGRGAITTLAGYPIDINFDEEIRVPLDGELISSGSRFLGSAFGHRCRIGTGIWIAPGREIPNDCRVFRAPEGIVRRIPDEVGAGTWVNDGGTLRPR